MRSDDTAQPPAWLIYVLFVVLMTFTVFFSFEFVHLSGGEGGIAKEDFTESTYMDIVDQLLKDADPDRGAELWRTQGCSGCHSGENAGRLAPDHDVLPIVAAERRPPLSAAAYIYESIVYPGAYYVPGFDSNMPRIYKDQLSDEQLGDMIAFLLISKEGE